MEKVEKVWGYEQIICNSELYCGKLLHLNAGYSSSLHQHDDKEETFYVLEGKLQMELGDSTMILAEGDSVEIHQNVLHRFTGIKDSILVEFSTHHEDRDSYRKIPSKKNRIVYVDIDGFLCTDEQGQYKNAKPIQENIDRINKKYDDGELIYIWTSRGTTTDINWRELTEKQLAQWGVKYHELLFGKPEYDEICDDKAMCL